MGKRATVTVAPKTNKLANKTRSMDFMASELKNMLCISISAKKKIGMNAIFVRLALDRNTNTPKITSTNEIKKVLRNYNHAH